MSSAVFMMEMIKKIKQNREILNARIKKKERIHSVLFKPISHQINDRKQKVFTEEEKARVIEKIDNDYKKSRRRVAIIETPIFIIIVGVFIWLMWLMFK
jgi:hypothetical protein